MSIRIALTGPPEFYTNLDIISGRVVLSLARPEQVGAIVVKLEGESRTALGVPRNGPANSPVEGRVPEPGGDVVHENHKILYRVSQVFPDTSAAAPAAPVTLAQGQYEFPFKFKMPINNACSNPALMARIGGVGGPGGYGSGPSLSWLGGIRVMNGSKQLMYRHVTRTLPPSFTGFPREAEIRYFIKVTVQRPGLLRENWRYQIGFKFLPIEPPRPPVTSQEAYARRPFKFQPSSPAPDNGKKRRPGLFASFSSSSRASSSMSVPTAPAHPVSVSADPSALQAGLAPSIEVSAQLPHPIILTCNKPIPLRVIAKKLAPSSELVYLTSLQINLIGITDIRSHNLINTETSQWVVVSRTNLSIPMCEANSPMGTELVLPNDLWRTTPLPNTVMPSFVTCNLKREYKLELKVGVSWGLPPKPPALGKGKSPARFPPQLFLPLFFSSVVIFSGMAPPPELLQAVSTKPRPGHQQAPPMTQNVPEKRRPNLPPRTGQEGAVYPPELGHDPHLGSTAAEAVGAGEPPYDDAPPSYDEAMAEAVAGPAFPPGQERPAYSGVTNENAPLTIPEKS